MIKRFAYIVLLLIFASCISIAGTVKSYHYYFVATYHGAFKYSFETIPADTLNKKSKQQSEEEKKKVKEIAKAKRQAKPEKIDDQGQEAKKAKPKRERRPEGLERPPEIPRRNGN